MSASLLLCHRVFEGLQLLASRRVHLHLPPPLYTTADLFSSPAPPALPAPTFPGIADSQAAATSERGGEDRAGERVQESVRERG